MSRLSALLFCTALSVAPLLPAFASGQAATVQGFSPSAEHPLALDRYMGRWYVVGRVPNPVERGHVASLSDYQQVDDNSIRVHYHYRDGITGQPQSMQLRASTQADTGYRRWRTWFYKIIPTRTDVLEVADDYSWALLGYPGRDMAWIMARSPDMDTLTYRQLLERLNGHGFNTDRMRRVVHDPAQLGQLGFETPRR